MKRLLIFSASAGTGHLRAAQALEAAVAEEFPGVTAVHHDALDLTTRVFKSLYGQSYVLMVNHTPSLWGLLYKNMERNVERKRLNTLVKAYDRVAYKGIKRLVDDFAPDAVLCTHFLPANVVLAKMGGRMPVATVVTDFDVHQFWINRDVARYFVATEEVAWQLGRYGIPPERIAVTGIPIHPRFSRSRGREAAARAVGVDPRMRTVMVVSSGFGGGDMAAMFERIRAIPKDFQLIVIAGRNEKVRKRLETLAARCGRGKSLIAGFVNNIEDYMESADLVVTKAGGLTVSECLARRLPMVIFSPIPGQEERNCDYLLEHGAAVKAKNIDVLDFKIGELLADTGRLDAMRRAAKSLAQPRAAFDIIARMRNEEWGARTENQERRTKNP